MHAVPAARGGPSEPGPWVLRRTGSVTDKYVMTEVSVVALANIRVNKACGLWELIRSGSGTEKHAMSEVSMGMDMFAYI